MVVACTYAAMHRMVGFTGCKSASVNAWTMNVYDRCGPFTHEKTCGRMNRLVGRFLEFPRGFHKAKTGRTRATSYRHDQRCRFATCYNIDMQLMALSCWFT